MPKHTKLIFLNGAELPYSGECKKAHVDRHILHKHLNALVETFVNEHSENCYIVDVNKCLNSDNPYLDTINHYKKIVYYRLASAILDYVSRFDDAKSFDVKNKTLVSIEAKLKAMKAKAIGFVRRLLGKGE